MSHPAQHINQSIKLQKRVLLVGTAADVLRRGQGVAYNRDYTGAGATYSEGSRDKRVEAISTSNNLCFAGVLDHDVTLPATGQAWVTINEPGSVCDVAIGSDTVVNATYLTALAGSGAPGIFRSDIGVKTGRGCAKAFQTVTGGKLVESLDGSAVVATKTVTKTGLFAGAAAGDKLVILASSTAAGAAGATPGIYTIASVTSDDIAVLTAAPGNGDLACYVVSGTPVALCELLDGEESGCMEWVSPLNNAATQSMVGGMTHVLGGLTLASGDASSTLANGTFPGERKGFLLHGNLTTEDYLVTVTLGLKLDGATDLNTIEMDADADVAILEWVGTQWKCIEGVGPTFA